MHKDEAYKNIDELRHSIINHITTLKQYRVLIDKLVNQINKDLNKINELVENLGE